MATPPFNLDISNPGDNAAESVYPANERAFRGNLASYINTEHDINSGHHVIPALTTAARDAIIDWPTPGAIIWNTDVVSFQYNNGTMTPNWVSIGPYVLAPRQQFFQLLSGTSTFTITVPSFVMYLVGGGGGGGAGVLAATPSGGAGGGGGAIITYPFYAQVPGTTISYSTGAAGGGGATTGSAGSDGGDTFVSSGSATITTATASGGKGASASQVGGAGGIPTGGIIGTTINQTGISGTDGLTVAGTGPAGRGGIVTGVPTIMQFGNAGDGGLGFTATFNAGNDGHPGVIVVTWIA